MKIHWLFVFIVCLPLNLSAADQQRQVPKIIAGAMSVTAEEVVALILAQPEVRLIYSTRR